MALLLGVSQGGALRRLVGTGVFKRQVLSQRAGLGGGRCPGQPFDSFLQLSGHSTEARAAGFFQGTLKEVSPWGQRQMGSLQLSERDVRGFSSPVVSLSPLYTFSLRRCREGRREQQGAGIAQLRAECAPRVPFIPRSISPSVLCSSTDCKSSKLGLTTRNTIPHHDPVPSQDFITFCVTLPASPLLPCLGGEGDRTICR